MKIPNPTLSAYINRPLFMVGILVLSTMIIAINIPSDTTLYVSVAIFIILLLFLPSLDFVVILSTLIIFILYNSLYCVPMQSLAGKQIDIEGIVESSIQTDYGAKYQVNAMLPFYPDTAPLKFLAQNRHPVRLTLYTFDEPQANMGDYITCNVHIEKAENISELSRGVLLRAFADDTVIKRDNIYNITTILLQLRWKLIQSAEKIYSPKVRGIVEAMVLGYNLYLDEDIKKSINLSGAAHILAVSGLHVSIVFETVLWIFRKLKLSKKMASAAAIPFLIIFMGLAGFSPSVMRAGIMLILSCIATILNRDYDAYSALGFSVIFILFKNPFYALNIGFLMSFFSVLGIILFRKNIEKSSFKLIESITPKNYTPKENNILDWLVPNISTSLSAYIFLMPILIYSFGTVQTLSWLTTALILWLVTPIVFLGLLSLIFNYLLKFGAIINQILVFIVELCCRGIIFITNLLSDVPFAVIYTNSLYVLLFSIVLIGSLLWVKWKGWNNKKLVSALLICAILLINLSTMDYVNRINRLEISSTENALVITKNGEGIVIGDIMDDYEASDVALILRSHGVTEMDMFLSTKNSLDESEGLDVLLKDIPSKKCVLPTHGTYLDFVGSLTNLEYPFLELKKMNCQVFGDVMIFVEPVDDYYEITINYGNKKILKTQRKYDIMKKKENVVAVYNEGNILSVNEMINGVALKYSASGEKILSIKR